MDLCNNQRCLPPCVLENRVQVENQYAEHSSEASPKKNIDARVFGLGCERRAGSSEPFMILPEVQGPVKRCIGGKIGGVSATAQSLKNLVQGAFCIQGFLTGLCRDLAIAIATPKAAPKAIQIIFRPTGKRPHSILRRSKIASLIAIASLDSQAHACTRSDTGCMLFIIFKTITILIIGPSSNRRPGCLGGCRALTAPIDFACVPVGTGFWFGSG